MHGHSNIKYNETVLEHVDWEGNIRGQMLIDFVNVMDYKHMA